jgi:hypothetical protein
MKHFLVALALFVACSTAAAQSPRAQTETFLSGLQKAQPAAAYAKLFEGSNIGPAQGENLRRQTEATLAPLGRVLGYDLLREEQFGQSLTRLVYLVKLERHPALWEFYYYRPGNRWFLAEVNFSQKFDALAPKR